VAAPLEPVIDHASAAVAGRARRPALEEGLRVIAALEARRRAPRRIATRDREEREQKAADELVRDVEAALEAADEATLTAPRSTSEARDVEGVADPGAEPEDERAARAGRAVVEDHVVAAEAVDAGVRERLETRARGRRSRRGERGARGSPRTSPCTRTEPGSSRTTAGSSRSRRACARPDPRRSRRWTARSLTSKSLTRTSAMAAVVARRTSMPPLAAKVASSWVRPARSTETPIA